MRLRSQLQQLLALLLLVCLAGKVTAEEEETISVDAPVSAVEIGSSFEIQCKSPNGQVLWYRGANATAERLILDDRSSRVHANFTTGKLTISQTYANDSGTYLCQEAGGAGSVSTELKVYSMLTYLTEGMIILGINAGLLVLFAACSVYTLIRNRRRTQANKVAKTAKQTKPDITTEL